MAQIAQYKVNQFAKDLNLKSKDIVDILETKKITVKSQATLDAAQFNVLFEALTNRGMDEKQAQNLFFNNDNFSSSVIAIPPILKLYYI